MDISTIINREDTSLPKIGFGREHGYGSQRSEHGYGSPRTVQEIDFGFGSETK